MCKERIPTVTVKHKKERKTSGKTKLPKKRVTTRDEHEPDEPHVLAKTWKFSKFHELLHIVDDIERFGAPMNYCAQRPESLLIPVAKQPGRRAQKRHEGSVYELQAAQRLSYSIIIDTMYSRLWNTDMTGKLVHNVVSTAVLPVAKKLSGKGTFATVARIDHPNNLWEKQSVIKWHTTTDTERMGKPKALMEFLLLTFGNPVRFCTEYVHAEHIYRCHPCYQSDGPLYDWMKANFDGTLYPCRLSAVVECYNDDMESQTWRLVVQQATAQTRNKSVLLTEWLWSPTYYVISPNDIVAPCFVISIKEDNSKILETLPIDEWYEHF